MLTLRDFSLSCGGETLLQNVNVAFKPGNVYALLGTNGIGKTCLLQAIVGADVEHQGSILADGIPSADHGLFRRLVAAAFETDDFVGRRFTGREFLSIGAKIWGAGDVSEELVVLLDMGSFIDKRIESYSLGMRQLLRVALAVQTGARYVLIDEPFNGLDPIRAELLGRLLRKLAEAERCVVMPTHDLTHADAFCDEGVAISNETLVFGGGELKPSELFASCYQN